MESGRKKGSRGRWGEAGAAKLLEKKRCVECVESATNVREKDGELLVGRESEKPCRDKQGGEVAT